MRVWIRLRYSVLPLQWADRLQEPLLELKVPRLELQEPPHRYRTPARRRLRPEQLLRKKWVTTTKI